MTSNTERKISFSRKGIFGYGIAILLSLLVLFWALQLWNADLAIPFGYGGDGLSTGVIAKGILDHGWYLENPDLGAPFTQEMYDYRMTDNLHMLVLKLLGYVVANYAEAINVYYLLTYVLTTVLALFVFRYYRISYPVAIFGSLLYSFLPYHYMRGTGHFFLSCYYLIPVMVLVVLWVYSAQPPLLKRTERGVRLDLRNRRAVASIVICFLMAAGGVYYAFFACFFLLIAGFASAISVRKWLPIGSALLLVVLITAFTVGNIAPSIFYSIEHGPNVEAGKRSPAEAELYGMKMIQLVLPTPDHRVPLLAKGQQLYSQSAPLTNENSTSSLGVVGALGFSFLIVLIALKVRTKISAPLEQLSVLNLAGFLLATIGGLSSLVSYLVLAEIRGYNRIVVFLGFFAIFAAMILIEQLRLKWQETKWKTAFPVLLAVLLVLAILDQTPKHIAPDYEGLKQAFQNDETFVKQIEAQVTSGAMIFQLPNVPFPENPPVHNMLDYQLFRGYLHSSTLRWSYGAMRGREGDAWQRQVADQSLDQMVKTLSLTGFEGIYINRSGFADNGVDLVAKLEGLLGVKPMLSPQDQLVFFNMDAYNNKLRFELLDAQWQAAKEAALYPLLVQWRDGFSGLEGTPDKNWRWSEQQGTLLIANTSDQEKHVHVEFTLTTGYSEKADFTIDSPIWEQKISVGNQPVVVSKDLTVPPGSYNILYKTNAKQIVAPGDTRRLFFRVDNFKSIEK